ncbi:MAG TPA: hypothetical protein VF028_08105 [Actinomycetota bacterium]|jgi:hypothetical protein|nr:hypothetical protein [Actinomycetota bacterium]
MPRWTVQERQSRRREYAMGLREERVTKNEAAAREINEQIEQVSESRPPNSFVHIICECGYDTCDLFIAVLKEEYEEVRDDPRRFIVRSEHVIPDVELIVEERDRYTIVAKRQGTPAQVATRTEPRA